MRDGRALAWLLIAGRAAAPLPPVTPQRTAQADISVAAETLRMTHLADTADVPTLM